MANGTSKTVLIGDCIDGAELIDEFREVEEEAGNEVCSPLPGTIYADKLAASSLQYETSTWWTIRTTME
jgi:hypothetical protein